MNNDIAVQQTLKEDTLITELARKLAKTVAQKTEKAQVVAVVNYYDNSKDGLMMSVSFHEIKPASKG